MNKHLKDWFCRECDEYFNNPEQYLSDDLPSCPFCESEDICEVKEIASVVLSVREVDE